MTCQVTKLSLWKKLSKTKLPRKAQNKRLSLCKVVSCRGYSALVQILAIAIKRDKCQGNLPALVEARSLVTWN